MGGGASSVAARGTTALIEDPEEQSAADALVPEPWEPGTKSHYVRLSPKALTGRRFKVNTPDVWNTRLNVRRRTSFEWPLPSAAGATDCSVAGMCAGAGVGSGP